MVLSLSRKNRIILDCGRSKARVGEIANFYGRKDADI